MRHRRTPLEYALMCLIAPAPMTGSEIVRLLRQYPLAGTGKSPGAVYPALHRLADAGLVLGRPRWVRSARSHALRARCLQAAMGRRAVPRGVRPTVQEFGLTRAGIVRLRAWATRRVTRREVLERPEHLLLRFVLCPGLSGPTAARRVAMQCRRVCHELARELEADIEKYRGESPPAARLGKECTLAVLESRIEWSRRAEREMAKQARREPDLDLPSPQKEIAACLAGLSEKARAWVRWPRRDGFPWEGPKPPPWEDPETTRRRIEQDRQRAPWPRDGPD